MISIYDLAKLTGVSATTVSNVLNGRGRFSEKTRKLVLDAAAEHGYVTNLAARGLHSGISHTVGIITTDVSNEYFSSIVLEIERLMRLSGYTSFICNTLYDSRQLEEYIRELRRHNCDGIFIVGGSGPKDIASNSTLPHVFIDFTSSSTSENSVSIGTDLEKATHDQVDTLARHGCNRIMLLLLDALRAFRPEHPIYEGYRAGLEAHGLEFDPDLEIIGPHLKKSRVESRELVLGALDRGIEFDGIVATGDRQALGAVEALQERGLIPGKDVLVIGLDNSVYSQLSAPRISTVERDTDEMARLGAVAMLDLVAGREPDSRRIVVPYRVIERETTLGKADR
ncbi:LacI family DNA-binding transcriptional regulator [Collinsella vaginalis]|uniref:LacI family DNA-binding transcriptional regulator n=1 Tax=Collinsella vaginalis TaxID=1870987 RepID=UPI0015C4EC94|nr:LacI family DNA-binding transcriptional regulator [Collinsella vaginalis]